VEEVAAGRTRFERDRESSKRAEIGQLCGPARKNRMREKAGPLRWGYYKIVLQSGKIVLCSGHAKYFCSQGEAKHLRVRDHAKHFCTRVAQIFLLNAIRTI